MTILDAHSKYFEIIIHSFSKFAFLLDQAQEVYEEGLKSDHSFEKSQIMRIFFCLRIKNSLMIEFI